MKQIQPDKILHFIAGLTIAVVVTVLSRFVFPDEQPLAYGLGALAAIVAGMAKELYDGWDKADQWDFAATIAGGAAGLLLVAIV